MKKIYIVILNYNGWKDTIECLESVLKSDYQNFQIIVVDNDSPNNSMDFIVDWADGKQDVNCTVESELSFLSYPFEEKPIAYVGYFKSNLLYSNNLGLNKKHENPLIFIQSGENKGFAAGNNIAIKYAQEQDDFEYIWLLNNDTVIEKNTLSRLVDGTNKDKNIGIFGTMLKEYYMPKSIQTYGGIVNKYLGTSRYVKNESELNDIDFISGASMLITKACINKVGLLPEEYFLYYEETDYCFRAKKLGFSLSVIIDAVVYHKEGATTKLGSKNVRMDLLFHSNRLHFAKKYLRHIYLVKFGIFMASIKRFLRFEFKQSFNLLKLIFKK